MDTLDSGVHSSVAPGTAAATDLAVLMMRSLAAFSTALGEGQLGATVLCRWMRAQTGCAESQNSVAPCFNAGLNACVS